MPGLVLKRLAGRVGGSVSCKLLESTEDLEAEPPGIMVLAAVVSWSARVLEFGVEVPGRRLKESCQRSSDV